MAFHLHRLKLVGRPLWRVGYDRNTAADIAAARTVLSAPSLSTLATRLGSEVHDLTRPLTADELRQWSFYRRAASNSQHVWAAACTAWRNAGMTDTEAAVTMGYAKGTVSRALIKPTKNTLNFVAAARLTTALCILEGPEAFLPLPERDNDEHSVS